MKKCLVLDLDNTLWGGIVGEDGRDGIALSLDPPGNAFMAFQQAILDLYNRGVILAISSRNNPADALDVIRNHPNMILKENHFSAMRINWDDKAGNIRELAGELNIGLDSMVFIDDDPMQRALVRTMLPEVETPELPGDPAHYARFLHALPYFDGAVITDEDRMRGNYYVTERLRKEEEKRFPSAEEFLQSLSLELRICLNDEGALPRLSQLTEKTNQFNIDKRPMTGDEMRALMRSPGHAVFHARLLDKFGDYGIISLAVVEKAADRGTWRIPALLMSCRVFGRGVEDAFVSTIAGYARAHGAAKLACSAATTDKNLPAREFVSRVFPGGTLALAHAPKPPSWITIHHANFQ